MARKRQPMQPVQWDGKGVVRFKANAIVKHLFKYGGIDMSAIAMLPGISREDHEQFAQLTGYSVSGWMSLGYVSDAAKWRAQGREAELLRKHPSDPAQSADILSDDYPIEDVEAELLAAGDDPKAIVEWGASLVAALRRKRAAAKEPAVPSPAKKCEAE